MKPSLNKASAMNCVFSHVLQRHVCLSEGEGYVTQKGFKRQNVVKLRVCKVSAMYLRWRFFKVSHKMRFCFFSPFLVMVRFVPVKILDTSSLRKKATTDSRNL
ncbi:hypothetical protein ACOMHN_010307 [Nucella lapillus]